MAAFPTCSPAGDQLLRLEREIHQLGVIVRVAGEIDLSSHLELRAEVFEACNAVRPPSAVVLDLTEVEFLASVGLTELLLCHERASAGRTPLRVVANGRMVLRPLEVTGLSGLLDLYPNVDEALAA